MTGDDVAFRANEKANQTTHPNVNYVGIDTEKNFQEHWRERRGGNIRFQVADARSFDGFPNASLACDLFTLQFIPERDRLTLLRRVYDGLVEGGALIIAAKVLANSAFFEKILTFEYYDFKRRSFSSEAILNKEQGLRGRMHLWDEAQLVDALYEAGFQAEDIHRFWQNYLFVGMVAIKRSARRQTRMRPARLGAGWPAQ